MDLQQLRYFLSVAEREHFTQAAEAMHVSQPHLSRLVRNLEHELGIQLLQRTTRSVRLTVAGEVFRDRVSAGLKEIDSAARDAQAAHAGFRGQLRIGFVGSVTYSWLPLLVRTFRELYQDVTIRIFNDMLTENQVSALHEGVIDVGIMRPPSDADVQKIVLASEELVVALPSDDPHAEHDRVQLDELSSAQFIMYTSEASSAMYRQTLEACFQAGFVPQVALSVGDTHTLISLVAAGMGLALIPKSACSFAVDGVSYRKLEAPQSRIDLLACWEGDLNGKPILANFTRICRQLSQAGSDSNKTSPERVIPNRDL